MRAIAIRGNASTMREALRNFLKKPLHLLLSVSVAFNVLLLGLLTLSDGGGWTAIKSFVAGGVVILAITSCAESCIPG